MNEQSSLIGIIGGTGALGSALATRLAHAGYRVAIGSREPARAQQKAQELNLAHGIELEALSNIQTAEKADLLLVTIPWQAHTTTLEDIGPYVGGKILVDTTVPLQAKVMRVGLPNEGAAAVRAQRILGPTVRVVSAFHNVAAHKLASDVPVECDVLVFGDDRDARSAVVTLAEAIGLRGLHGGALVNSAAAEALTSVLIFLNKTYAVDGAGIRITGRLNGLSGDAVSLR